MHDGEVWFLLDDLRKMKGKTRMHIHCTDDIRAFPDLWVASILGVDDVAGLYGRI